MHGGKDRLPRSLLETIFPQRQPPRAGQISCPAPHLPNRSQKQQVVLPCRVFPDLAPGGGAVLVQFLRFMILINQLIPISLYVTLELVKVMQCTLLTWDLQMYHRESGTPFLCRTTTLNEELGQVQYVLSDKTGWSVSGKPLM